MTAREVAQFVLDLANVAQNCARDRGIDELRMSRARDAVLRFQDQGAMSAHQSNRDAVALFAAYELIMARVEHDERAESVGDDKTPTVPMCIPPESKP